MALAVEGIYRPPRIPVCTFYKSSSLSSSEESCDEDEQRKTNDAAARYSKQINSYDSLSDSDCQEHVSNKTSTVNQARCRLRRRPRLLPPLPEQDNDISTRYLKRSPDDGISNNHITTHHELYTGYYESKALLAKRFEQLTCMIEVPNGSGTKEQGKNRGSIRNNQSNTTNSSGYRDVSQFTQRTAATGGFGDDPDDPRKPSGPRKEPQDKIDDDNDTQKCLKYQEEMLAKLLQSINVPSHSTSQNQQTQTSEEGNVEALNKKIKMKDKEISAMQNLINCCRNDYEELQQSFDTYKKEFEEVDTNRAFIRSLTKENADLKENNLKKDRHISNLDEGNKRLKNKLSKQSIDCDFLRTEKLELLKQLRSYEQSPTEPTRDHTAERKEQETAILCLKKSSSLQEIKILRAEEKNNFLTLKIEHLEGVVSKLNQVREQAQEQLRLQQQREEELKNKLVSLSAQNSKLSSKYNEFVEFTSETSNSLRRIYDETRDATKRLVDDSNEVKSTSSPLSVELARAQNIPTDRNETDGKRLQVSMFIRSITAAMDELKDRITRTKLKLDKITSNNENKQDNKDTILEMSRKLTNLQEELEDKEAKCKAIEDAFQDKYKLMLSSKDKQINNLQNELSMALAKQGEIQGEYQTVFHDKEELQTTLTSVKTTAEKQTEHERELREYIEELETETQRILGNLTRERRKSQDLQRSFEKAQTVLSSDPTEMQEQLHNKIRELANLLEEIDQSTANDSKLWDHPYTVAMEKGMQILYDVTSLVNAIGRTNASTGSDTKHDENETKQHELEAMIEFLERKNKQLQNDKQKLEKKVKKTKVTFAEDTIGGEETTLVVARLQQKLLDKDKELNELKKQINMLQLENDTIEDLLRESKQQAKTEQEKSQADVKQLQLKLLQDKDLVEVKMKRLEELNNDLLQKIQLYDNLFNKGNERKGEQEQTVDITVPVDKLHNAIKFLEKRVLKLQDEKQDIERQMKTMFSTIDTDKELWKCQKERQELDLEVQNKQKTNNSLQEIVESTQKRSQQLEESLAERTALQDELTSYRQQPSKFEKENELIQRNAEIHTHEKITSLEAQLKCRTDSEQELCDKMCVLEQRTSLLEAEKLHHAKTITSMIRTLQAKEDLAKAIKARDDTEKDFNKHLDEMEVIVANLKKEKQNPQSDEELKAKYKAEYYESREKVRKLNATLDKRNQLIDEMRGFVKELRKEEQKIESTDLGDLKTHFDVLRSTLEDKGTTEQKLKKKLKSLKETISQLEAQKQESDTVVESLLKSVDEKDRHKIETLSNQLKGMKDAVLKLTNEKQNLQNQILMSHKIIDQTRGEIQLQEKSSQENMENLEKSLQGRHDTEKAELKKILQRLNAKVQEMEADKSQTEKSMKILLNSLKCKDDLENSLKEKQITEKALSDKLSKLQEEKCRTLSSLQQQLNDITKRLEEKTAQLAELQETGEQKGNVQEQVTSLTKQLSEVQEEKKVIIKENQALVEKIFKELDKKTCRIKTLEGHIKKLKTLLNNMKETLTLKHEEWTKTLQERDEYLEQEGKKNQDLQTELQESKERVSNLSQEIFFLCKHNRQLQEETQEIQHYLCGLEETRKNDQYDLTQRIRELVAESKIDNEKIEALERDIMLRAEMQNRIEKEMQDMKTELYHEKIKKAENLDSTKQRVEDLEREIVELKETKLRTELHKTNDNIEQRATKAILESMDDSEQTMEKIRSNWQHINSLRRKEYHSTAKPNQTQ